MVKLTIIHTFSRNTAYKSRFGRSGTMNVSATTKCFHTETCDVSRSSVFTAHFCLNSVFMFSDYYFLVQSWPRFSFLRHSFFLLLHILLSFLLSFFLFTCCSRGGQWLIIVVLVQFKKDHFRPWKSESLINYRGFRKYRRRKTGFLGITDIFPIPKFKFSI